jgi:glutamate/tyrosine decarboxylase-like PLP-dependent enzyme
MAKHSRTALPQQGIPFAELKKHLDAIEWDEVHGHWSRTFRGTKDVQEVGRVAFNQFFSDNGFLSLHADYMANIRQELIDMCVSLFHPDAASTASLTSGGSESIYSALHVVREWAKVNRPAVKEPTVLAPQSAHPSFSKGCHYLGMKLMRVPLTGDYRVNVSGMRQAITEDTVCLVGSAPNWPHTRIDPIEELADLALEHDAWMHVDACVGGYMLPFLEKLGVELPPWDFRVPGVMSISADLHKLGYCPKPCSTILWRDASFLRHHLLTIGDTSSGVYRTEGFLGSRPAGPIFAAWSVFKYLGEKGFLALNQKLLENTHALTDGINAIEGLTVWKGDVPTPLSFYSDSAPLGMIMGGLSKRKRWFMLGIQDPPMITLPVDAAADASIIEPFLSDLREVTEGVLNGDITDTGDLRYG